MLAPEDRISREELRDQIEAFNAMTGLELAYHGDYRGRFYHIGVAVTAACLSDALRFWGWLGNGPLGDLAQHAPVHVDDFGTGLILSWPAAAFDDEDEAEAREAD